jgi:hypothetical protein
MQIILQAFVNIAHKVALLAMALYILNVILVDLAA